MPHWASAVPAAQVVPLQQPVGHKLASHAGTHSPLTHSFPAPHWAHAKPFAPQAAVVLPGRQVVPLQHPVVHEPAVHIATHCWFSH